MISISPNVIPQKLIPSRITLSTVNPNVTSFRIRKCKTVTYQNSFFNRTARIWNILPECIRMPTSIQSFKLKLLEFSKPFVQAMILKSLEPGNLYVLNVKMLDC